MHAATNPDEKGVCLHLSLSDAHDLVDQVDLLLEHEEESAVHAVRVAAACIRHALPKPLAFGDKVTVRRRDSVSRAWDPFWRHYVGPMWWRDRNYYVLHDPYASAPVLMFPINEYELRREK